MICRRCVWRQDCPDYSDAISYVPPHDILDCGDFAETEEEWSIINEQD